MKLRYLHGVFAGVVAAAVLASSAIGQVELPPEDAEQTVNALESPIRPPQAKGWKDVPVDTPPDDDELYPAGTRWNARDNYLELPQKIVRYQLAKADGNLAAIAAEDVPTAAEMKGKVRLGDIRPGGRPPGAPRTAKPRLQTLTKKKYLPLVKQMDGNWPMLVVAYTGGTSVGASTIPLLTNQWQAALQKGSTWGDRSQPALRPHVYGGAIKVWNKVTPFGTGPAGQSRYMNYAAIWAENNVCALINSGAIKGVVVWNAGEVFNDYEHARQDEYFANAGGTGRWHSDEFPACSGSPVVPYSAFFLTYANCIGDDPQDGTCSAPGVWSPASVDNAIHSFTHWIETRNNVMPVVKCDFRTLLAPYPSLNSDEVWSPPSGCILTERGFTATYRYTINGVTSTRPSAVCGDVHFPPNYVAPRSPATEYIYWTAATVPSQCWGWQIGATPTITQVGCATWGCTPYGYYVWWMKGIPGIGNNHRDQYGGVGRNWWFEMMLVSQPVAGNYGL